MPSLLLLSLAFQVPAPVVSVVRPLQQQTQRKAVSKSGAFRRRPRVQASTARADKTAALVAATAAACLSLTSSSTLAAMTNAPAYENTREENNSNDYNVSSIATLVVVVQPCSVNGTGLSQTLSVTGVAKAPIHQYDYSPSAATSTSTSTSTMIDAVAGSSSSPSHEGWDDPKQELVLTARLVTAVMMGVMLGVERRVTSLNLGVRSITLLSMTAAITTALMESCYQRSSSPKLLSQLLQTTPTSSPLLVPLLPFLAPTVAITFVSTLVAGLVYVAARTRRRDVRFAERMSLLVGLSVGMGVACGAGLGLLTAALYLAGVGVARSHPVSQQRSLYRRFSRRRGSQGRSTTSVTRHSSESVHM